MNAVITNKKCLGIGDGGLCTISIWGNMQPQLYKQLQCILKCNMLQLAVALLLCKIFVFKLASSSGKLIKKVSLLVLGLFAGGELFVTVSMVYKYIV